MSSMDISKEEDARMKESRAILVKAFYTALGSYIEQEAKKLDDWRDKTFGEIYAHLKHEIEEIRRSKSLTQQLHNCIDAVMLSTILLAKLMEDTDLMKREGE